MEPVSGLKSEIFRPLVTLVIPGAVSIAPYILVTIAKIPASRVFWHHHPTATAAVVLSAITAAGLALEDLGARIEESGWDVILRKENEHFDIEWRRYLRLRTNDEIIAQRYVRSLITRMKFELAMVPALVAHLIGLNWVNSILGVLNKTEILLVSAALLVVASYLLAESLGSARALMNRRQDVVLACHPEAEPPFPEGKTHL